MTKEDRTYELLIKSLANDISEEEKNILEEELSKNKKLKGSFSTLLSFWNNFFPSPKSHAIIEKTEKKLGFTYGARSGINFKKWMKVAATILFLVSVSFSVFQLLKPKHPITLNEYSCSAGELKEVVLSDGTKVWLNSSSLLIASEPFVGDKREVTLFGEAYFEVAHNEELPFIVETVNLKTKVLGTHFNMVAFPTDEVHEISLYEGSVEVHSEVNSTEKRILKPGDRAYFNLKEGTIDVVHTDLGKEAQWRDGILRFYDEDLFSISKKLERKFQSRIFIADSIVGNLKYSAEFEDESLEKILKILCKAQAFNYEFTNNGVLIQSKN